MKNKLFDFIDLHEGEEQKEKVLENIVSNISFRGSNLWILACAIVIASVGLNVNSTAVIIGAMLISPLMGPIVGTGFALAVYDFDLLLLNCQDIGKTTFTFLCGFLNDQIIGKSTLALSVTLLETLRLRHHNGNMTVVLL